MLIIDGHVDLAYNAMEMERDLTLPVAEIRRGEDSPPAHGEGTATVSLPALRAAGVRIVQATIFAPPDGHAPIGSPPGYRTAEEAFQRAKPQVDYYHQLQAQGQVTILQGARELEAVLAGSSPQPGLSLLMEGADPIVTPADLPWFVARGVHAIGLTWQTTRYASGTGVPGRHAASTGPLTAAGRELLAEMARLGVVLDVSHLAEEAFWQALDCFGGRVIASHANCRALVPGDRHLSDEMIRAIADRDGVIGLVFYNRFIKAGWTKEQGREAVSLQDLRRHADHLRQLVGTRHIALGSDLDGGVGWEVVPHEIDTIADLPRFAETLAEAGYSEDEIAAIMGENWLRLLREVLA